MSITAQPTVQFQFGRAVESTMSTDEITQVCRSSGVRGVADAAASVERARICGISDDVIIKYVTLTKYGSELKTVREFLHFVINS